MKLPITPREKDILQLASEGYSQKLIGIRLGHRGIVPTSTVKNLLTNFNRRHGTSGITEAVAMAIHRGWITGWSEEAHERRLEEE